jgi:uncharacterized membrane protein YheB (UPF0754 family)
MCIAQASKDTSFRLKNRVWRVRVYKYRACLGASHTHTFFQQILYIESSIVISMVTSIQISEELKQELSSLKKDETYEEVIAKLLKQHKKAVVAEQMKAYGKKYAEKSLKELKEWDVTDIKW